MSVSVELTSFTSNLKLYSQPRTAILSGEFCVLVFRMLEIKHCPAYTIDKLPSCCPFHTLYDASALQAPGKDAPEDRDTN